MSDYYAVSRKLIRDREFWTVERVGAWCILLGMTAWSDHEHNGVELQAGQFLASINYLARRFDWTPKKVRHFLVLLEQRNTIRTLHATPVGTVYEVVKWSVYQQPNGTVWGTGSGTGESSSQAVFTGLGAQHTAQYGAKRKEGSKRKLPSSGDFDRWFDGYPAREGGNPRKAARYKWDARIREGVAVEQLFAGRDRYIAYLRREGKIGTRYVMRAATFLGPSEHWAESYAPAGNEYAKDWRQIVHITESKSIRSLTRKDLVGLSVEARHALDSLGGFHRLKTLSAPELKDMAGRFYGLCADYSQEVQA